MTLKDKRRELELSFLDCFPEHQHIVYAILEGIEQQDAQAIKELKEELTNSFYESKEIEDTIWFSEIETLLDNQLTRIDKIFGDFEEKQQ